MKITRIKDYRFSKDTSESTVYHQLWTRYSLKAVQALPERSIRHGLTLDPFARNCAWAWPWTNDIDPNTQANFNLDAEDFLKCMKLKGKRWGVVLLDPPFSDRQAKEAYGSSNLYASDSGKMKRIQELAARVCAVNGYIIKAGFNTNPPAKNLELVEVVMVQLGGNRNDVLFSVWEKTTGEIDEWGENE